MYLKKVRALLKGLFSCVFVTWSLDSCPTKPWLWVKCLGKCAKRIWSLVLNERSVSIMCWSWQIFGKAGLESLWVKRVRQFSIVIQLHLTLAYICTKYFTFRVILWSCFLEAVSRVLFRILSNILDGACEIIRWNRWNFEKLTQQKNSSVKIRTKVNFVLSKNKLNYRLNAFEWKVMIRLHDELIFSETASLNAA